MWAKAHFAAAATELSLLTAPYYIWLDAGACAESGEAFGTA